MIVDADPLSRMLRLKPSPLVRDLHAEQLTALRLRGRWRGIMAGRRSGKSYFVAVWLLGGRAGQVSLYAARTLKSAKAIMLPIFAELNARYNLGLRIRAVEGEVIEPSGHIIRFHGLKDKTAADLLLGQRFRRVAVDEGGAFDSELLEYCITKVLQPTLFDVRGDMAIVGTPGPVPKGYFYDLVGDPNGTGAKGRWPTHGWDLRKNPHLAGDAEQNIQEILEANGWTIEHSRFKREVLGQWVNDAGSLIYNYQGERWAPVPDEGKTVLVIDFAGSDKVDSNGNPTADSTAFLVGRQPHKQRPHFFLVEGFKKYGINLQQIADTAKALRSKWNVGRIVVDAGALGAGYAKTLREVFSLHVVAADKRDKRARIGLAQATLDTKTLHVCKDASAIVDEWLSLQWDLEHKDHHEACADDLSDALLYMLNEFNLVEPPGKVIERVTDYGQRVWDEVQRRQRESSGTVLYVDFGRTVPLILPAAA